MPDERKGTKHKCFDLNQIIWKQTNRVEKRSIITICKYLVKYRYSWKKCFIIYQTNAPQHGATYRIVERNLNAT